MKEEEKSTPIKAAELVKFTILWKLYKKIIVLPNTKLLETQMPRKCQTKIFISVATKSKSLIIGVSKENTKP